MAVTRANEEVSRRIEALGEVDPRERVQQILSAAVRVIGSGGTHGVTHRAVAQEAGVSPGLTTYYFKDRDDLIDQAATYAFHVEAKRLGSALEGLTTPLSVDECVALLTEMFFDKAVADPLYDITLFEMFLEAPRSTKVRALTQEWTALILELVDRVLPPTDPSLPRQQVVQIVAALIDGLMLEETSNQTLGLNGLAGHLRIAIEKFVR